MDQDQNETALIRVSFRVPRPVRDALAEDAKQVGVPMHRHVKNELTPLVPNLFAVLAGQVGTGREAA